jgi:hypothetical protein
MAYYSQFRIEPDNLSDDDFAKMWNRLEFALKTTGQMEK